VGVFSVRAGSGWATMRPWGPRYLEPMAPLVVVLVVAGIVALWRARRGRVLAATLIALSVVVQLLAIATPFGTWTDRVREETGSSFNTVFVPRYSPLWGQVVLLSEARADRIQAHRDELTRGEPSEAFKRELRQSYDFWFVYAYRLGVPLAPLAAGAGLLLALVVAFGLALWRALGAHAPPPVANAPA
jgi:hypothetical protein